MYNTWHLSNVLTVM